MTGPGINCPGDCTETYDAGTPVLLTASPASSPPSDFKGWSGDCTGTGSCSLVMDMARTVIATFERFLILTVRVTSSFGGSGTVTSGDGQINCQVDPGKPSDICTGTYVPNDTVDLTATPDSFSNVSWGADCAGAPGNTCSLSMDVDKNVDTDFAFPSILSGPRNRDAAPRPVAWESQLDVGGGEGQVVMNGRTASAVRPGLAAMVTEGRKGVNRVEAVLVRGGGRPGSWRFDFSGHAGVKPGSLRAVAGTVALITGETVVFHLQGKPGERVVFTFEVAGP